MQGTALFRYYSKCGAQGVKTPRQGVFTRCSVLMRHVLYSIFTVPIKCSPVKEMTDAAQTIRLGAQRKPPPCAVGPGDRLTRFQLDAVLGWGGQAVVFRATDLLAARGRGRQVAVKVVRADLPPEQQHEAAAVLRWEAHLLRRLQHLALPRLFSSGRDPGLTWLARELAPGPTLAELAAGRPVDQRQVQHWAIQVCDLLRYLHTRAPAVICGDLKPANLVLRNDGALMLIDLGAAQTRTRRPPRRPRPRHGTPGYAPPEQMGSWGGDERSDLFSLAVTCYELLTGLDPTVAPLQFDLEYLAHTAPALAPALRWALALAPEQRPATAAVWRTALAPPLPPQPLHLGHGVRIASQQDMIGVAVRHPHLLEAVLRSGEFENWLADHPDRKLGTLLHALRATGNARYTRERPLDRLLNAMAPAGGSPLLQITPAAVDFGPVPLNRWRIWSAPQQLQLANPANAPLRWEIECPLRPDAKVRLLVDGRTVRTYGGVLPPGGRLRLELVARGRSGQRQGQISVRCGNHLFTVPWRAVAQPGVAVGRQFASSLADLDLSRPDLIPALEQMLLQGTLARWMRVQGDHAAAGRLTALTAADPPPPLATRLAVLELLHSVDPLRFPLLAIDGAEQPGLHVVSGATAEQQLVMINQGQHPSVAAWCSRCAWAQIDSTAVIVQPGGRLPATVTLLPPPGTAPGSYLIELELRAGDATLPVSLTVHVVPERWWQKLRRWFGG